MQMQYYPMPAGQPPLLYHLAPQPVPPNSVPSLPPNSCLGGPACAYYAYPLVIPQQFSPPPQAPAFFSAPQAGGPPTFAQMPSSPSPLASQQLSGLTLQFQSLSVTNFEERPYTGNCGQDYNVKLMAWLKTHRMHKYYERLRKYTFDQLLAMERETLEAEQFTQGAIKKLLGMVERVKQDRMAFDCPSRSSGSPSSSGTCSEEEQLHASFAGCQLGTPMRKASHQGPPLQRPMQRPMQQLMASGFPPATQRFAVGRYACGMS